MGTTLRYGSDVLDRINFFNMTCKCERVKSDQHRVPQFPLD